MGNDTDHYRQSMFYRLQSHRAWDYSFFRFTKSVYTSKTVYTAMIWIWRIDLQFSIHWRT